MNEDTCLAELRTTLPQVSQLDSHLDFCFHMNGSITACMILLLSDDVFINTGLTWISVFFVAQLFETCTDV